MYPTTIKSIITLMVASIILYIIGAAFNYYNTHSPAAENSIIIKTLVSVTIETLIFTLIIKKKNWARYIWLIIFVGNLLLLPGSYHFIKHEHDIFQIVYIGKIAVQFIFTVLLFIPTTNKWLKE